MALDRVSPSDTIVGVTSFLSVCALSFMSTQLMSFPVSNSPSPSPSGKSDHWVEPNDSLSADSTNEGMDTYIESIDSVSSSLLATAKQVIRRNPYHPTRWASSIDIHGQLQTMIQTTWRYVAAKFLWSLQFRRELLNTVDGGVIAVDWVTHRGGSDGTDNNRNAGRLVILYHGLCGASDSEYIVHLADILLTEGYEVACVVARGCGGLSLTSTAGFMPPRTVTKSDLETALEHIRRTRPDAQLFGVGFSLGAALMLKELAKQGLQRAAAVEDSGHVAVNDEMMSTSSQGIWLRAAVCISPPWNMLLKTPYFTMWSRLLSTAIKLYILTHYATVRRMGVSFLKVCLYE
jgi:predicted alpha/beta-fold hydrolase